MFLQSYGYSSTGLSWSFDFDRKQTYTQSHAPTKISQQHDDIIATFLTTDFDKIDVNHQTLRKASKTLLKCRSFKVDSKKKHREFTFKIYIFKLPRKLLLSTPLGVNYAISKPASRSSAVLSSKITFGACSRIASCIFYKTPVRAIVGIPDMQTLKPRIKQMPYSQVKSGKVTELSWEIRFDWWRAR